MEFYRLQNDHYFNKKRIFDTNVDNDVTSTPKCDYTCGHTILWHDVIHWF